MSKKSVDTLRSDWVNRVKEVFEEKGFDVLQVKTNEFAIPVVDSENEDQYVVLNVKIPKGSRDGEPYDGYSEAENFKLVSAERAEKAKEIAAKKAKKIERDKKLRAEKAAKKAEKEED